MKNKKKLRTVHKVIIAISLVIACLIIKILGAQFFYSEVGYKPVNNGDDFRMALSVSPFTARAFDEGYTYEYEGKQITSIEELEQLYIDKGATEMYVRIATKRHVIRSFICLCVVIGAVLFQEIWC